MKRFIFTLLIAALSFFYSATNAHASDWTVGFHTVSMHTQPGFNNINPGVYFRHVNGLTGGAYFNSKEKPSLYVAYSFTMYRPTPTISFDVAAGIVSGYDKNNSKKFLPGLAPSVKYGKHIRLGYVPPIKGVVDAGVVHLMYEREVELK